MSVKPPKVLILDTQTSFRDTVQSELLARGYVVECSNDGLECLEKTHQFRPDLVLIDLMLPGIHGVDVLTFLRNNPESSHIKLVACSSKVFRTEVKAVHELGAIFVPKPVRAGTIADKIDHLIGRTTHEPAAWPENLLGAPDADVCYLPNLSRPDSYVKFWGTRGSVPVSGRQYIAHGGNTSCVEIRSGEDVVILDAGTGIRPLGALLMRQKVRRIHLFVTHTHWDHIQGFPFFAPAFLPGFEITVYGASGFGKDLHGIFQGQLDKDYFPVQLEDFLAKINFHVLLEKTVRIGNMTVSWEFTNHPGAAVAYQVELFGRRVAYVSDNEFARGWVGDPVALDREHELVHPNLGLLRMLDGVDVLIHEAQYMNDEYPGKIGWGHSSLSNACQLANLVGAKRWVVTHHDPAHSDEQLDNKLIMTQQILSNIGSNVPVTHAMDEQVLRPW